MILLFFFHASPQTLDALSSTLKIFCTAASAHINWDKSRGFWISEEGIPDWGIDIGFAWIQRGVSIRYLLRQVGLGVISSQQFSPMLESIRRKPIFWSNAKLDLAVNMVVVTQVLLAIAWFVFSC